MIEAPPRVEWADWHVSGRPIGCWCCGDRAAALFDGEPVCLDCGDLLLERLEAVALVPAFRRWLPAVADRVPGL